jgi:hypothetical protein
MWANINLIFVVIFQDDLRYLGLDEGLEMPDMVGLGLGQALHQQLRDLRLGDTNINKKDSQLESWQF